MTGSRPPDGEKPLWTEELVGRHNPRKNARSLMTQQCEKLTAHYNALKARPLPAAAAPPRPLPLQRKQSRRTALQILIADTPHRYPSVSQQPEPAQHRTSAEKQPGPGSRLSLLQTAVERLEWSEPKPY